MSAIHNSPLLDAILNRAEELCKSNSCSGLTRDYIIVAAIAVLEEKDGSEGSQDDEFQKAKSLLAELSHEKSLLDSVLEKWNSKKVPMTESMILSTKKGKSLNTAMLASKTQLTADIYLAELLHEDTPAIAFLRKKPQKEPGAAAKPQTAPRESVGKAPAREEKTAASQATQTEQAAEANSPATMGSLVLKAKKLQSVLQSTVLGQDYAVSVFASGFFQSELQAEIEKERKRPRATFLFAGPPGVGKTFLSEEAARVLELPFRRFDMSEYTGPNATNELSGTDESFRGSSEGQLTGFVNKNPQCVLLFDEIEKASLETIHLFLQILDAGRLRDNRTDKEISFKDTILIFTTNAGKALYENADTKNLSAMTREVILDALAKDVNPRTKEPFFPAAICSRFASGNVVMFNHLGADTLRSIIARELAKHAENIADSMDIKVNIGNDVPTALLLAEGAMADARTVKSRANSFFGGELYELFRLVSTDSDSESAENIRSISISVNLDQEAKEIVSLFSPAERIHAVAYAKEPFLPDEDDVRLPVIHYVQTLEEAKQVISEQNAQLVFCDVLCKAREPNRNYLNLEDRDSEGRDFLMTMLTHYPQLPVVLLEPVDRVFSEEEKTSFLRKGVQGFLSLAPDQVVEKTAQYAQIIFQQNNMSELARSNQLLHYETAQSVSADGSAADIVLFDMKLEKAIKAEDANNVLSLLSTPDVKFDDVIGADDAKDELKFFISYMQQPRKYRRTGISAPKGVLLYGPPGTGKTMLAKAFAAESHATFIATEGNQFFQHYVGDSPAKMHNLFATARRYAPAVVFIDEIDTIGRVRTGRDEGSSQVQEEILTALFSEMDGFSASEDKPVFVLGATNYSVKPGSAMSIDPALLRRFDRHILVELPTLENRTEFLRTMFRKKEIFQISEEGIQQLADRSTGMSLALLSNVLNMAIRIAVRRQADHVDDRMLEEAFETFNSGEEKKWGPEIMLRTARHEAGHTLVSWLSGEKPTFVTIVSRSDYGGYMQYGDQEKRAGYTRQELLNRIRTALGGRAAEIVYYGEEAGLSTGPSSDLKAATDLATHMLCRYGMDEQFGLSVVDPTNAYTAQLLQTRVNELLKKQLDEAIRTIQEHKEKMDIMVNKLLKMNSLRANDIDNIMKNAIIEEK